MTVAVKYCGGCNPRYGRLELAARMKKEFPWLEVGGGDAPSPDLVLVICGCDRECASHGHFTGYWEKLVLSSPEGYGCIREAIIRCMDKG